MKFEREEINSQISNILQTVGFEIKQKQLEGITNILNGVDTLCILPTGYGKSLIFQLLPTLMEKLEPGSKPILIVVSPLLSLIADQIAAANRSPFGLKACSVTDLDEKEKEKENFNMFVGTPEAWLSNKGKQFLSSNFVLSNAISIVVDEVHKVTWGSKDKKSD